MQVDSTNYFNIYPKIVRELQNCNFVAIDVEFSGLSVDSNCMHSLFDTLEDRYKKLCINVSHFIPTQFGLSVFTKHESKNEYKAQTYSLFCCPRAYGPPVNCFSMEINAVEFLIDNKFDFNRFARFGIPFLNQSQAKTLKDYMANKAKIELTHSVMDKLAALRSKIAAWISSLPLKKGHKIGRKSFYYVPFTNPLNNFLVVFNLRREFTSFWIQYQGDQILVYSIQPSERKQLMATCLSEEDEVIKCCVGLSRLIQALIDSKKPIIGNNMMTDMAMIYNHFIDDLPGNLQTFKDELLKRYNAIYDIKAIITNVKKYFPAYEDDLVARNLGELYNNLTAPTFIDRIPYQPAIIRDDDESCDFVNRCHDAGSDAYATGCVFLRVCAMIAHCKAEDSGLEESPQWDTLISSVDCFRNKINLIRAAFHYMDLEAKSQVAARPEWLVLRCRNPSDILSLAQAYTMFAAHSNSVDFRPINDSEIILAIGNFKVARDIIERFKKDKNYKITRYNVLKDTQYGRLFLWTTLIVGAGTTGYLSFRLWRLLR